MFWDNYLRLCNSVGKAPNTVAKEIGIKSSGTVTGWANGAIPRRSVLVKIGDYFGTSVSQLLNSETDDNKPPESKSHEIGRDLKFALFGTDDIDDFVFEEVKRFAQFAKERYEQERGHK